MLCLLAVVLHIWPAWAMTTLQGGGSSLAGLVWNRWTTRYKMVTLGVNATYIETSSGQGVQDLTTKTDEGKYMLDWAGSDYLLQNDTYDAFPSIQMIPILAVSVAIVIFIPGIDSGDLVLDVDTAALLFADNITQWDDPRILALQQHESTKQHLRGLAVQTKVRSGRSGTTEILARYLAQSPYWPYGVYSIWPAELPHERIAGTNALLGYMQTVPGCLSYAPLPFVASTENTYVSLRTPSGVLVQPTKEYVFHKIYPMQLNARLHATLVLSNETYPITDVTYSVFQSNDTGRTCDQSRELMRFLRFVLAHDSARAYAENLGYVPLPLRSAAFATVMDTLLNVTCPGEKQPLLALTFQADHRWSPMRIALACVALVLCLACYYLAILVFHMHSLTNSDRSTGLAFSLVFIAGCVMACVSVFFWVLIPIHDWVCVARVLFSLLALALLLGGLVAQTWVVWDLLNAKASGIKQLEALAHMYFALRMGLLFLPQCALAIVWLVMDTPTAAVIVLNDVSREAIHSCSINYGDEWLLMEIAWFVVVSLIGMWMALRSQRRFPTRATAVESNSIFLALERLLICLLFCIGVVHTQPPNSNVFIFAVCCALLVPTALSLLTVMIPKVQQYNAFQRQEKFAGSFGPVSKADSNTSMPYSNPARAPPLNTSRYTPGSRRKSTTESKHVFTPGIDCGSFVFFGDGSPFEDHQYEFKDNAGISAGDFDVNLVQSKGDGKSPMAPAIRTSYTTLPAMDIDTTNMAPHEYINMMVKAKKQQQRRDSAGGFPEQVHVPVRRQVSFELPSSPDTEQDNMQQQAQVHTRPVRRSSRAGLSGEVGPAVLLHEPHEQHGEVGPAVLHEPHEQHQGELSGDVLEAADDVLLLVSGTWEEKKEYPDDVIEHLSPPRLLLGSQSDEKNPFPEVDDEEEPLTVSTPATPSVTGRGVEPVHLPPPLLLEPALEERGEEEEEKHVPFSELQHDHDDDNGNGGGRGVREETAEQVGAELHSTAAAAQSPPQLWQQSEQQHQHNNTQHNGQAQHVDVYVEDGPAPPMAGRLLDVKPSSSADVNNPQQTAQQSE